MRLRIIMVLVMVVLVSTVSVVGFVVLVFVIIREIRNADIEHCGKRKSICKISALNEEVSDYEETWR